MDESKTTATVDEAGADRFLPARSTSARFVSLENLLPRTEPDCRLEINPVTVITGHQRRLALSVVYRGATPLAAGGGEPPRLSFLMDRRAVRLVPKCFREEAVGTAGYLAVAVYDIAARDLERVAESAGWRVEVDGSATRVRAELGDTPRANLRQFLDQTDPA